MDAFALSHYASASPDLRDQAKLKELIRRELDAESSSDGYDYDDETDDDEDDDDDEDE